MFVTNLRLGQLDASSLEAAVLPDASVAPIYIIGGLLAVALAMWWGGAAKKTVKRIKTAGRRREARARRKAALKAELAKL